MEKENDPQSTMEAAVPFIAVNKIIGLINGIFPNAVMADKRLAYDIAAAQLAGKPMTIKHLVNMGHGSPSTLRRRIARLRRLRYVELVAHQYDQRASLLQVTTPVTEQIAALRGPFMSALHEFEKRLTDDGATE